MVEFVNGKMKDDEMKNLPTNEMQFQSFPLPFPLTSNSKNVAQHTLKGTSFVFPYFLPNT